MVLAVKSAYDNAWGAIVYDNCGIGFLYISQRK